MFITTLLPNQNEPTNCSVQDIRVFSSEGHDTNDLALIVLAISTRLLHRLIGGTPNATESYRPVHVSPEIAAHIWHELELQLPTYERLNFEYFCINPSARQIEVNGCPASLSAREFELLLFLVRHPRQVFSRAQLLDCVWGVDFAGGESTVTVHIRRLREKIEPAPDNPIYIQTVWGVGYKFDPQ